MSNDHILRKQLEELLAGGHAHMGFERVVESFPVDQINTRAPNFPYTPWHLLEHMRIAQWDILAFIQDPNHVSPTWPEGYWPSREKEADSNQWSKTVEEFRSDLKSLREIVADPNNDLTAPLPHGDKYNILREILIVADHNAYHLGELAAFRQILGS